MRQEDIDVVVPVIPLLCKGCLPVVLVGEHTRPHSAAQHPGKPKCNCFNNFIGRLISPYNQRRQKWNTRN